MGLSICYELRLPKGDFGRALRTVQQLHVAAVAMARNDPAIEVFEVSTNADELDRWACGWLSRPSPDDPDTIEGVQVTPVKGAIFPVAVGQDCEPVWLGLCRYPASVNYRGQCLATQLDGGWRLAQACKTQYASLHGWDHFRRCHTRVIELLRAIVPLGGEVKITDEGGWWPHRSDEALREKLENMNRFIAGFAGALKDKLSVRAPILSHPKFEHLEAEGYGSHPLKIEAGISRVANELKAIRKSG